MLEPGAIIFSKKDEEYQQKFPVKMLSRVLEVSVNGYYAWKRRPASTGIWYILYRTNVSVTTVNRTARLPWLDE
jgi:hypothetical protein